MQLSFGGHYLLRDDKRMTMNDYNWLLQKTK